MKVTYIILLCCWYFLWVIFLLYIYFKHHLEYSYETRKVEKMPPFLNPIKLSILLYNKIEIQAFIATIYFLILKGKLTIKKEAEKTLLIISKKNMPLTDSQKFVADFLTNVIGDKGEVSLQEIHTFCNGNYGKSTFILNYQIWYKMVLKENANNFLEPKLYYSKMIWMRNIGIVLFLANIIMGIHNVFGYLLILAIAGLLIAFKLTYKRTKETNQLYHDFKSYKEYLTSRTPKIDSKQVPITLLVGTILKVKTIFEILPTDKEIFEQLEQDMVMNFKKSKWQGDILWNLR